MKTKCNIELEGGIKLSFDVRGANPDEVADMFVGCTSLKSAGFTKDPIPKLGLQTVWLERAERDLAFSGHRKGEMIRSKFGFLKMSAE